MRRPFRLPFRLPFRPRTKPVAGPGRVRGAARRGLSCIGRRLVGCSFARGLPAARRRGPGLRAPGNRDAASRGWGTHLTASLPVHRRAMHGYPGSSVATQHQGDSLRRLAMHA
ncbi:hypothetical protein, partial [Frankia sp. Cj3]|uniref:hypothetical protein n=1 Tax=Frankia sp. Cj3 TaxID=2880976 RepID=UPI001EF5EC96